MPPSSLLRVGVGGSARAAVNRSQILDQVVFPAYREIASAFSLEDVDVSHLGPDVRLIGRDGALDSLKLVSLIVTVEGRVEEQFGKRLVLADERAMSQNASPFRTLGALADYIVELLAEP